MAEAKAVAEAKPAPKPRARSIADDIDAVSRRIAEESESPKARYAQRYLKYARRLV
jgi:hypothetical protein